MNQTLYTGKVRVVGGREGAARSDDGRLDIRLSTPGGPGAGTNPEQLLAAGWSACFQGAMAIAATAWIGRDLTQLAAQPVVFGLAYLALALAVAVRFGAIPFHLWAARLTDAAPETALPVITVLAPASLAVVALAWNDAAIAPLFVDLEAERMVLIAVRSRIPRKLRR